MTCNHFFKPLLPGFTSGVPIPLNFFSKNLEGRTDLETVELRSEASDIKWTVKIDGHMLTTGWKEFVEAHQFKVGDILIFRYIADLTFMVFGFGPSCCEITYVQSSENCDDDKEEENKEEEMIKRDDWLVSLSVTKDSIKNSRLYFPKQFAITSGLERIAGNNVYLMNENGVKWPVKLVMHNGGKRMCLTAGLREFIKENNIRANFTIGLELIWKKTSTPVLKLYSKNKTSQ